MTEAKVCEICSVAKPELRVTVATLDGEILNSVEVCGVCAKTFELKIEDLAQL